MAGAGMAAAGRPCGRSPGRNGASAGRALGAPGGGVTWQEEAPPGEPGVGGLGGGAGRAPRRLADGVLRVRKAKVAQVPRWRR